MSWMLSDENGAYTISELLVEELNEAVLLISSNLGEIKISLTAKEMPSSRAAADNLMAETESPPARRKLDLH